MRNRTATPLTLEAPADLTAVNEPLYAHYLATTGRRHPGDIEVLESQDRNGARVIDTVLLGAYATPVEEGLVVVGYFFESGCNRPTKYRSHRPFPG